MMRLYLMRHAEAAAAGTPGVPTDAARPLTEDGRLHVRRAAEGLARLKLNIGAIVSSPLLRAQQTAQEAAGALKVRSPMREWPELRPSADPQDALHRLAEFNGTSAVLFVGHEPHLSAWIALLTSDGSLRCLMKKGAVACVEIDHAPPAAGSGLLRWLVSAKHLGHIGKGA